MIVWIDGTVFKIREKSKVINKMSESYVIQLKCIEVFWNYTISHDKFELLSDNMNLATSKIQRIAIYKINLF